jgi:predicted ferric reductase
MLCADDPNGRIDMTIKTSLPLRSVDSMDELQSAFSLKAAAGLLLAMTGGAVLAAVVLPALLPGLAASLMSAEPKAYWYLSRTSAFVAFALMWASMIFGLLMTSRTAKVWPGGPAAFDLHQFTSLLGLAVALFHAVVLIGDKYIGYSLSNILLPFNSTSYKPLWVGIGQIAFYIAILVSFTFYFRKQISQRGWRLVHFASFELFVMALAHGVLSGTDTGTTWAGAMYWIAASSVLFLTMFRIFAKPSRQK